MMELEDRAVLARTDHERTNIARQIDHTDREIDRLVDELYGLSDDEIGLVEGATAAPASRRDASR
jgi:hypothetical protein